MTPTRRALVFAPLVAPLVYWAVEGLAAALGVIDETGWGTVWGALAKLPPIALRGLAVAYPATLLLGWPLASWLGRKGRTRLRTLFLAGAALGVLSFAVAGWLVVRRYQSLGEWFLSADFLGGCFASALAGGAVALAYWALAHRGRRV